MIRPILLLSAVIAITIAPAGGGRAAQAPVEEIRPEQAVSFLNTKVQREDKVIGRAINVIIKDGTPHAAIIDLAGYMGVGNHKAVVPWDALRFDPTADPVQVTIHLSAEQIRALAKVKPSTPPTTASLGEETHTPTPREKELKLIDATLYGTGGKELGKVTDVLVDSVGRPRAVIIAFGGTLDPNGREIAVAWAGVSFGQIKGKPTIRVNMTRQQAKAASAYKSGKSVLAIVAPPSPADQPTAIAQ